jgi:hypothetical protein
VCDAARDDLKFFLDDVPAELPPAKPQRPLGEEFAALRDKIRALAREAVEMNKQGQAEQAQNKIDEARLTILNSKAPTNSARIWPRNTICC